MQIITIDGPASSGKGTVARLIANKLGFNYLESGAIYRVVALVCIKKFIDSDNVKKIIDFIDNMKLEFIGGRIFVDSEDVTDDLRNERVGMLASTIGKIPEIRARLLDFQRGFATAPGLVTDGRDMGSVVFPNANLKIFLTADPKMRAKRRHLQIVGQVVDSNFDEILADIIARDKQDSERSVAPLTYDKSFVLVDNSDMTIDETVKHIISMINLEVI